MARPKPLILCSYEGKTQSIDILKTPAVWAITHLGEIVSIRHRIPGLNGEIRKYPKTQYPTKAAAINAARRLNTLFDTDAFSITRVQSDTTEITEPPLPDLTDLESVEPN